MAATGVRPQIEFDGELVIKRQPANQTTYELEKTTAAAAIASACGLFLVPHIVSKSEGVIVYMRFRGFSTIRSVVRTPPCSNALMERLGRALATVHHGDPLAPGRVFLHQDFGA